MRRGTTPILRFRTNQDWTDYTILVTLEDDSTELNFTDDRLMVDGTDILLTLTQEETLKLQSKKCSAQIKGKKDDVVIGTDIAKITVLPILNEEVM